MKKKKVIFIDFDGTICFDKILKSIYDESSPLYNKKGKIASYFKGENEELSNLWMIGKHSSEEFCYLISDKENIEFELIFKTLIEDCKKMKIDSTILDKLLILKKKFFVVLATSNMDCLNRFTVPSLGLSKYFDHILNSYYLQFNKTDFDGRFYLDYLKKKEIPITDSILIDNSESTCSFFEGLGGKSFYVDEKSGINHYLDILLQDMETT